MAAVGNCENGEITFIACTGHTEKEHAKEAWCQQWGDIDKVVPNPVGADPMTTALQKTQDYHYP